MPYIKQTSLGVRTKTPVSSRSMSTFHVLDETEVYTLPPGEYVYVHEKTPERAAIPSSSLGPLSGIFDNLQLPAALMQVAEQAGLGTLSQGMQETGFQDLLQGKPISPEQITNAGNVWASNQLHNIPTINRGVPEILPVGDSTPPAPDLPTEPGSGAIPSIAPNLSMMQEDYIFDVLQNREPTKEES